VDFRRRLSQITKGNNNTSSTITVLKTWWAWWLVWYTLQRQGKFEKKQHREVAWDVTEKWMTKGSKKPWKVRLGEL
jgi:hypothetical protein